MNKGGLTIFIPTYNRSEKLKRTLDYMLSFLSKYNFSILIGNNASTDETIDFLNTLSNPNVSFYSNTTNIGIIQNIYKGIQKVNSEWVWIYGDDDIFHPKVLDIFFKNIEQPEGFYFRYQNFKEFDWSLIKQEKSEVIQRLKIDENTISEANEMGFITSYILRTKEVTNLFQEVINSDEQLKNNAYTNKLVNLLYENRYGFTISKDILIYQDVSRGSHFTQNIDNIFKVFVKDELYIYKKIKERDIPYIKLYKRKIFKKVILRPFYFYRMEKGEKVKKELKDIIEIYHLPLIYKVIVFSPTTLIRLFYKLYKTIK